LYISSNLLTELTEGEGIGVRVGVAEGVEE